MTTQEQSVKTISWHYCCREKFINMGGDIFTHFSRLEAHVKNILPSITFYFYPFKQIYSCIDKQVNIRKCSDFFAMSKLLCNEKNDE